MVCYLVLPNMFWAHNSNLSYFKKTYSVSHTITLNNAVCVCVCVCVCMRARVRAQSYPTL